MKRVLCFLLVIMTLLSLCSCDMMGFTKKSKEQGTEKKEFSISLNTYSISMTAGETRQLVGTLDIDKTLMWKSSNESVAVVNSQGVVTGVSAGVVNITCYAEGAVEAVCTVTVTAAPVHTTPTTTTAPPTTTQSVTDSDMIFPHSSYSYLSESEIAAVLSGRSGYSPTGKYAQDAINEIYARNGYVFNNKTISSYYNAKSWYFPDPAFSVANLNKYEQSNVALLKKFL